MSIHKKTEKKRGPSYWKLNSSILENKDHKNNIFFLEENKIMKIILPSGGTMVKNSYKA